MKDYLKLLNMSYKSAVSTLNKKYGKATTDYFLESSYERLLAGEIKTPTRGQVSRTNEGLYCHHVREDRYHNMAKAKFIIEQKIPFKMQSKDHLVYCNLIEHAILHTLISKESGGKYGAPGLFMYLAPMINEWYIVGNKPTQRWEINCYNASFVEPDVAGPLLQLIMLKSGVELK